MYGINNYTQHSEINCFNELTINEICFQDIKPFPSVLVLISLILLSHACNNGIYPKKEQHWTMQGWGKWDKTDSQPCLHLYSNTVQRPEWSLPGTAASSGLLLQKLQDTWKWHSPGAAADFPFQSCAKVFWNISAAAVNRVAKSSAVGILLISLGAIRARINLPWQSSLHAFLWGWILTFLFILRVQQTHSNSHRNVFEEKENSLVEELGCFFLPADEVL